MARMRSPWQVTGLRTSRVWKATTGFSRVGMIRKSGQTRLLNTSLSIASMVSGGPWMTTGLSRLPTSRSVIIGTSLTWSKCEWVRKMSSISRISSSSRAEVMAPPSMVSRPSIRKQVVRCRGSSPPWQPRTLIFILVPEPLFHLEKLEILLHLARIGHHHALRHQRDDARLGGLAHRLLHLFGGNAHAAVQFGQVHRHQLALGRLLAALVGGLQQMVDHAAVGVAHEEIFNLLVRLLQPVGELLDQSHRDLHVAADHRLEGARVDDQELGVLVDGRARGARLVVQDAHLTEEFPPAQGGEDLLVPAHRLGGVHLAGLDDVHLLAGLALAKEHLAALELLAESLEQRVLAGHAEFLSVVSMSGQFK